jgi:DNA-binding LacI/PurR family transcriptional regulator
MTVGVLKAAEEMGLKCPEDYGLVSFDDYPWLSIFRPRLTTVELPKYQLGHEAASLLLDRIGGKTGPAIFLKLLPELRVRESCGFKFLNPRSASHDAASDDSAGTLVEHS